MTSQSSRAAHFRELHSKRPLILPNAWDAGSARAIERAGADAIATSSAGVAWSLGRADGQRLSREQMVEVVRSIAAVVSVPVSADVEGGYGSGGPADIAETVRAVIAAGAVGVNLEDSPGRGDEALIPAPAHVERIRAARDAARAVGGDIVINARTDVFLAQVGAPETRFDEAVRRAKLYRQAGADCLFVPGVIDAETIAALVRAIDGPLNILARAGAPTLSQLGALGVARVSLGSAIALAALTAAQRAARELLEHGTYAAVTGNLTYLEANAMFEAREKDSP
ncbi:MAG: isocitrate lyase/phosphoenolpyruvate mutase family protein [Candidatus Eisenbacteria bacterium]|uniref:Isocitrate lyase/phosphoenolpyruvate mutase family protein n=1 Tax=Eiseniibacteriota bacterium TaxID=2212470 RepID=A0A849SGR8_UNCEI|nr:isocitrate lyase/phosphoenolpyruvate mutase family protein [Candidatus Eisenbacteria bacterium]